MLLKQAPLIADNIDVFLELLPSLGPNEIDPLLYWCGNLMPLANSMGVLKSRTLMKAALPLSHLLPRVPRHAHAAARRPAGDAENEGREWWRFGLLGRSVALARIKFVGGVAYYVLEVDDQYAGEFRFKFIRELYLGLAPVLPGDCPEFPSRTLLRPWSAAALEERRAALERFLVYVLGASFTPGRCRACHMSSRAPPSRRPTAGAARGVPALRQGAQALGGRAAAAQEPVARCVHGIAIKPKCSCCCKYTCVVAPSDQRRLRLEGLEPAGRLRGTCLPAGSMRGDRVGSHSSHFSFQPR